MTKFGTTQEKLSYANKFTSERVESLRRDAQVCIDKNCPFPGGTGGLEAVAFDPINNNIYVTSPFGNVFVIDDKTNKVIEKIPVDGSPPGIAVDTADNKIFVSDQGQGASLQPGPRSRLEHRTIKVKVHFNNSSLRFSSSVSASP